MVTDTTFSLFLGSLFVLLGALNVWVIYQSSRAITTSGMSERLIRAHRLGGYLFIAVFCFMSYVMAVRTANVSEDLSMSALVHVLVAMSLVPLLFVKVLIARYYKNYYSALTSLGLVIFCLAFVLVALTAGRYLIRAASPKEAAPLVTNATGQHTDLRDSEALMQKKCAHCHTLDCVIGARKDAVGWSATVDRMRSLPGSHISQEDASAILAYLVAADSIDSSNLQGELKVGKALVDSHCGRCHQLDRVYKSEFTPDQWQAAVTRMVGYARGTDGFFKQGEYQQIIRFLSKTQTPEAATARRIQSALMTPGTSSEEGRGLSPERRASDAAPRISRASFQTGVVVVLIIVSLGTLVFRRPKRPVAKRATPPGETNEVSDNGALAPPKSFVLQLVRIERQTHDCVSLRFRLPQGAKHKARPGQFMTFSWLLGGEKIIRSYTISSSSTQSGYIEITPKRAKDGLVSAFLNEQAATGLTVEAIGPAGQFFFDELMHRSIVLFAGGSGITPMISILRFLDDRCLDTEVTLFYTVRTQRDIVFKAGRERLTKSLPHFTSLIALTRPEPGWEGLSGHVMGDVLPGIVKRQREAVFFLCGPESFMSDATKALTELGIPPSHIKGEAFGSPKKIQSSDNDRPRIGVADFARSAVKCDIPPELTLLEVAEMDGITIPYSCRQGQCGTCATRLLEGSVRMDSEVGLSDELRAQGCILPCVSRAQGDVKLDA